MKDNSLDGHRGKVAVSETTRNLPQQTGSSSSNPSNTTNSSSTSGKCDLKAPPPASAVTVGASGGGTSNSNDGPSATNFDDDYNEWELGIGDLIIDLDADIEKTNERNSVNHQQSSHHHHHHTQNHSHHQNGSISVPPSPSSSSSVANSIIASPTASSATAFSFLGTQSPCGNPGVAMSNSKSSRNVGSAGSSSSNVTVTSSSSSASSGSSGSVVGGIGSGGVTSSSTGNTGSSSNSSGVGQTVTGAVEHQATVDKGLKMKIKRKTVGNKYSEAKHEIVQSDTKSPVSASEGSSSSAGSVVNVNCAGGQASSGGPACNDTPKSKHSSSKGRNNSHREKKEKNREKDKSSSGTARASATVEVNGVLGVMSPSLKITNSGLNLSNPGTPTGSSAASPLSSQSGGGSNSSSSAGSSSAASSVQASRCGVGAGTGNSAGASNAGVQPTPTASPATASGTSVSDALQQGFASTVAGVSSASNVGSCSGGCVTTVSQAISLTSNSPPMPNLTLKLENKFSPTTACSVVVKQEDRALSPPMKRLKMEPTESDAEASGSPVPPEMKDTSTCTSVGTITEPDCLGPCEPGTSVMLEGIVWQETEGGVLVVNVTWRGKTYVGTLLDCTKHDWAPPRFCESPTSDVDAKTTKGRGKRGRGANSSSEVSAFDTRNCVQSKLRNGKGRRTTINSSFTVPSSPAKSEGSGSNSKRKGRPADLEISQPSAESKTPKRSRVHSSRGTPTPSGGSSSNSSEFPQPSSPLLIECPEPNCSKKYKHINGLRYHQQHAHSGSSDGNKLDDTTTEDSKDVTNSSDNEESTQENISVPASPAMSFANSVSPHPGTGRPPPAESSSSASSSSAPSLPESETYTLTQDLSTLATVAVGDPKSVQKTCSSSSASRATPTITPSPSQQSTASQELPVIVATDGTKSSSAPAVLQNTSSCSSVPISVVSSVASAADIVHSPTVPAAANTVIQASVSDAAVAPTAAVTVSIPTSHVVFNQGITAAGVSCVTTTTPTTTVAISCHGSTALPSPRPSGHPAVGASAYVPVVSSVSSVPASSPSAIAAVDKSKPKQQVDTRPDKYKPKSPLAPPGIRPIVPAPAPQLIALQSNIPSSLPPGVSAGGHGLVTSSLKPIQPKPTILGEPTNVNPALESLKKDKSKHKKKSKDKERKPGSLPLSVKMPGDECEPVEVSPYPSLEAVAGNRDPLGSGAGALPGVTHQAISSLDGQKSSGSLDLSLADDNMNENVQSPAYSDISDANDTAPVLESEVPPVKEKEDKVGKTTPDAAQSPATNISAYGMYPYYSQPPYLLPSVSPQNSTPGGGQASVIEKQEQKKTEQERVKESRPWSNPAGELRERPSGEPEGAEKKVSRENGTPNSGVISSPAAAAGNPPLQEYQMQQPYPYSYGYVQGYPYAVEQNYHMHLLESEQYKQYIEGQQRLYKEQQQQQQMQQQQQQQQHHHQQQQQQHSHQQQQQHSSHHHQPQQQHHHHSQHQSHHHSKIHHSSMLKDDRDRSRDHKDRLGGSASSHGDHMGKMQHSSVSLVVNKEHDIREQQQQQQQQQQPPPDGRPPSLPTQVRSESSTPSASASLKEKQNENHQILKENIELKSQMDDKNKINQFEMAMLYERHREDMRRYYMLQERIIEQQQQKMEPGYHHHTHHHQTIQAHQMPSHSLASLKSHKDDIPGSGAAGHSKPNHYESSRSSAVMSPAKSDHMKISSSSHPHSSSSSPKGSIRDSSVGAPKDYASSSSRDGSTSKKDGMSSKSSDRSDSSGREEKVKSEKLKSDSKPESEGQKPTMETTGPPPPPTNAYAYLHPSYLQPPPPHFPHMPFEPAHAVYRSGLNPMIMSTPPYGSSPYMHPQLRYVPPGTCEIPAHSQASDPLGKGLHPPGPPKALDLLHQVSQHYTTTHKIHELQEHALMSPTPTSTPTSSTTPSSSSSSSSAVNCKVSTAESTTTVSKVDAASNRDSSRSPPTQRHLHTHHHTHVGVGYPIYDPYGAPVPQRPCT